MPDSMLIADSTLVGVANRILDMGEGAVASISQSLKEIAPEVWEILMRQVYVSVIADFAVSLLGLIIAVAFFIPLYRKANDKEVYDEEPYVWGSIASAIVGIMAIVAVFINGTILFKVLMNPEYYAAMKFFELVGLK